MTFNILDRLLGLKPIDWSQRFITMERENWRKKNEAEAEKQHQKNTHPSHPLVDYIGHYMHPAYGEIIIGKEDGRLSVEFRERTVPIDHYQYDTFRISDEDPDHLLVYNEVKNVTFLLNKNGDVDRLTLPLQTGVDDIVFEKVDSK